MRQPGFEWCIVLFGVGICAYFSLPFEPSLRVIALMALTGFLARSVFQKYQYLNSLLTIVAVMLAGVFWSTFHTSNEKTAKFSDYRQFQSVSGWIEAVEPSGSGTRWLIRVDTIERLEGGETPYRVRVKTKPYAFKAGDAVQIRAMMTGPPGPAIAGGYDPARRAYFDKVGAYGFAVSEPIGAQLEPLGVKEKFDRALVRVRYGLADRIMAQSPDSTAALQAALLTGVRVFIPKEQTDVLRASGLAHVLAISGLHMGLLAGGAFFLMSFLLAHIDWLARRTDVRKYAAIIGALVATIYLGLSGATVSSQRAYIMAMIVFLAVILDRQAFSMRSVAVAAAVTLFLHPESVISPGFQMSFAAAAALVAVYQRWRRQGPRSISFIRRRVDSFVGIGITSLVAGVATGGFAALIFHRIAKYGFIANLAAMPVFTFLVMPFAFLSLLALPFGLEAVPLWFMGQGVSTVLAVAQWTAELPGAVATVSAAAPWVLAVFGLGFSALCLGPKVLRLGGGALLVIAIGSWSIQSQPDMRVSDTGKVAFWDGSSQEILYVDKKRTDGYGRDSFISRAGLSDPILESYGDSRAACDPYGCLLKLNGHKIALISHPSEAGEACATNDLVILTQREIGIRVRRKCRAQFIDGRTFEEQGAQSVFLPEGGPIYFEPALTRAHKKRPWSVF